VTSPRKLLKPVKLLKNGIMRWTQAEIGHVKTKYPKLGAKKTAKELGRSISAVRHKASRLGIERFLIDLSPTRDLGYFCGLVLGDGSLCKSKAGYMISFFSTKQVLLKSFEESIKKISPNMRSFRCRTGRGCRVSVYSKILYHALKQFKPRPYYWVMPSFLTTNESQLGFIQGMFDADGAAILRTPSGPLDSIKFVSKYRDGLNQIKDLLAEFGISSWLSWQRDPRPNLSGVWSLRIYGAWNFKLFGKLIGTKDPVKHYRLGLIPQRYETPSTVVNGLVPKMKELRRSGVSYLRIGKYLEMAPKTVWRRLNQSRRTI